MRAAEAKRPRDGSRKAKVYDLYHETTKEDAVTYGLSLGLKREHHSKLDWDLEETSN